MPQVMIISSDGYFYLYNIDLENGGECALIKQYKCVHRDGCHTNLTFFTSLLDSADDNNNGSSSTSGGDKPSWNK